jgi:NTE family protein
MDHSDGRPVSPTGERLHAELRRLDWAKGLSEETFAAITATAEWVEFRVGDVVIGVESEVTHVCFLITGRMQATLHDFLCKEIQRRLWADCTLRANKCGGFPGRRVHMFLRRGLHNPRRRAGDA